MLIPAVLALLATGLIPTTCDQIFGYNKTPTPEAYNTTILTEGPPLFTFWNDCKVATVRKVRPLYPLLFPCVPPWCVATASSS